MQTPRVPLSDIVRRGATARRLVRNAEGVAPARPLRELTEFGSDPGNLRALCFVPKGLPRDGTAALVVALHGCTQTAAAYDRGCGWSVLAEREGFALLLPEQRRANNQNLCFNWFEPGDVAPGRGEVASIYAMIGQMLRQHRLDGARVFVTGLSAGGAMTAALLACYPETFTGGAVFAGIAFGAAAGTAEALDCMSHGPRLSAAVLVDRLRAARPATTRWPAISLWQGEADHVVVPANATALAAQWTALHGLPGAGTSTQDASARRTVWHDAGGRVAVELIFIPGMAHGVPIDASGRAGAGPVGEAAPFILDVGVPSTLQLALGWGIAG